MTVKIERNEFNFCIKQQEDFDGSGYESIND
jgi:hypothetical protein